MATFTVWVHVRLIDAGVSYDGNATQEVRLWFRKEGEDNWKLYGYGHRRPSSGSWPDIPAEWHDWRLLSVVGTIVFARRRSKPATKPSDRAGPIAWLELLAGVRSSRF
ncbi:MAG: hypothetical protein R3B96_06405 [Pirellulaceae bacterium]